MRRQPSTQRYGRAGLLRLGLILAALLSLAGCAPSRSAELTPAPQTIRIGWVPNDEDVERRVRFDRFSHYLATRLARPVELVETGTYSTVIEAMRAAKLDIASMGPFAYLIAHDKAGAEAIIAPGAPDGAVNTYRSTFVVRGDSPLRSMDDVKAQAAHLTLAWVDPASASGHLVPRAYLESIGMDPEKAFKTTVFTLSHIASAMTIKSGQVDVAVISQNIRQTLINTRRIAPEDLRVLWTSEPIVTSVVAVRGGLSTELKEAIRAAYLAFRTEDPEGWGRFHRLFPSPTTQWVAAYDRDYDSLRALARSVKNLDLLEK